MGQLAGQVERVLLTSIVRGVLKCSPPSFETAITIRSSSNGCHATYNWPAAPVATLGYPLSTVPSLTELGTLQVVPPSSEWLMRMA
jgi:hypothetical protein